MNSNIPEIEIAAAWNSNEAGMLWTITFCWSIDKGFFSYETWGPNKTYGSFDEIMKAYHQAKRGFKGEIYIKENPELLK